MGVKVSGLNHMLNKLEKLGRPDLIAPSLTQAVREGAQLVYDAVEENTPTSTDRWTDASSSLPEGELKRNLQLVESSGERGLPRAVVSFDDSVWHVGMWVEKGHRLVRSGESRVLKSGKTSASRTGTVIGHVPGTHFFRAAVEGKKAEVGEVVRARVRKAIDDIAKG